MNQLVSFVCSKCCADYEIPIDEARQFNKSNKFKCNDCSSIEQRKYDVEKRYERPLFDSPSLICKFNLVDATSENYCFIEAIKRKNREHFGY